MTDRHALHWNIIARLKTGWAPWTELTMGAEGTKLVRIKFKLYCNTRDDYY